MEAQRTDSLDNLDLRGYQPADLHAMFTLDQLCFSERFRFSKASMRRFAEARHAQVSLAYGGEPLAGFSIVHPERHGAEPVGYLVTLDVSPVFRRRGLAKRLLHRAEAEAHAAGCEAMVLHVFAGNKDALALYAKLDYVRVQATEHFYGKGLHAWVYRKALPRGDG